MSPLDAPLASTLSWLALANTEQEYPNKPDHVIKSAGDLRAPHELHPVFFGSFDWHSSVHMHWSLVRLLRLFPQLPEAPQIRDTLDQRLAQSGISAEVAYLREPGRETFERPYGWAWLLKLQTELTELAKSDDRAACWRDSLRPLAHAVVERYLHFLPLAQYPVRAGTHTNSAFGLLFALEYAETAQEEALGALVAAKAASWFEGDRRYPAGYEPGGEDFLPPGLLEAVLMRRVLDGDRFADWWETFCPSPLDLQGWLTPVEVSDRGDFRLAHLDGLNLARAWCWRRLKPHLDAAFHPRAAAAVDAHIAAALPHASNGDYAGTHWLASFALLALSDED